MGGADCAPLATENLGDQARVAPGQGGTGGVRGPLSLPCDGSRGRARNRAQQSRLVPSRN